MANEITELDISDYNYLNNMGADGWAWEYTRRNFGYKNAWRNHRHLNPTKTKSMVRADDIIDIGKRESDAAAKFGMLFFPKPKTGLGIRQFVLVAR